MFQRLLSVACGFAIATISTSTLAQYDVRQVMFDYTLNSADMKVETLNRAGSSAAGCDAGSSSDCCDCSVCAGYSNGFYVKTADDAWMLKIRGLLQTRWIGDWRDLDGAGNPAVYGDSDEFVGGLTVHRGNMLFYGNIGDPRLKYWVILASSRVNGDTGLEEAKLMWEFENGMVLSVGRWHNSAFLREQAISYTRQMGAERPFYNEVFTINEVEAVLLTQQKEFVRWQAQYSDGRYSGNHANRDFYADLADVALTGRVDLKLCGDWGQFGDLTSWECEDWGIMLGGGLHWEDGETGNDTPAMNLNNFWQWTADVGIEGYGLSLFGAAVGRISQNPGESISQYGFTALAAYQVIPDELEPFVRYENVYYDGVADVGAGAANIAILDSSVNILSLGVNRYFNRHAAKWTTEVLYALDPISVPMPHIGFLRDNGGKDGQVVLCTQMQLFF